VELRKRGVAVLPAEVNKSGADFSVEQGAVRVSLGMVKNMNQEDLVGILAARKAKRFSSFRDFVRRSGVKKDVLESLVLCGACDDLGNYNRRQLYWAIPCELHYRERGAGPNLAFSFEEERYPELPDYPEEEKLRLEYEILGITPRRHFMAFWRERYGLSRILTSREALVVPAGETVRIGGLVVRPHRPPTKSGKIVVFLSLEDEFGLVDVNIFQDVYQKYGGLIFGGKRVPMVVTGKIQRRGQGMSVTAWKLEELKCYFDRN